MELGTVGRKAQIVPFFVAVDPNATGYVLCPGSSIASFGPYNECTVNPPTWGQKNSCITKADVTANVCELGGDFTKCAWQEPSPTIT